MYTDFYICYDLLKQVSPLAYNKEYVQAVDDVVGAKNGEQVCKECIFWYSAIGRKREEEKVKVQGKQDEKEGEKSYERENMKADLSRKGGWTTCLLGRRKDMFGRRK